MTTANVAEIKTHFSNYLKMVMKQKIFTWQTKLGLSSRVATRFLLLLGNLHKV
jgi:hypothetical protein